MVTSLEKFKSQYPDGALIAELVSINEGQYIVRAAVVRNAETLATGLAANADVQVAEDQARERAIAALGISITPAAKNTASSSESNGKGQAQSNGTVPAKKKAEAKKNEAKSEANGATPKASKPAATVTVVAAPLAAVSNAQTATAQAELSPLSEPQVEDVAIYSETDPLPDEEDLGPPIDVIDEKAGVDAEPGEAAVAMPAKPSAATIALETFSTSANPVDLSDVIAQTDVELTRLGWTSEQGRAYLEQNYGKRSRQQLTDDELMSFLLHLEDQA